MALEFRFEKSNSAPWGFRLAGGNDFDFPPTVIKILEGSVAQHLGLHVGDVVCKINQTDVSSLTHTEIQDAIVDAGNNFSAEIYRGDLSEIQLSVIAEEQNNDEVYNILEGTIPIDLPERPYVEQNGQKTNGTTESKLPLYPEHDLNLTDEDIHSVINPTRMAVNGNHAPKELRNKPTSEQIGYSATVKVEDKPTNEEIIYVATEKVQDKPTSEQFGYVATVKVEENTQLTQELCETTTNVEITQQKCETVKEGVFSPINAQIMEEKQHTATKQSFEIKTVAEESVQKSEFLLKQQEIIYMLQQQSEVLKAVQMEDLEELQCHVDLKRDERTDSGADKRFARKAREERPKELKLQKDEPPGQVLSIAETCLTPEEIQARKWSTFLQKPNCTKPPPKPTEQTMLKEAPYRVVIRTKKDLEAAAVAKRAEEEAAIAAAAEAKRLEEEAEARRYAEEVAGIAQEILREAEEEAVKVAEERQRELEEFIKAEREMAEEYEGSVVVTEFEEKHISTQDTVITVEQQLLAVKEQLMALSELPDTIQVTLHAISEQLQKIALEAQVEAENDASIADNTETEDEVTELLILEETQEALSVVDEEDELEYTEEHLVMEHAEAIVDPEEEEKKRVEEEKKRIEEEKQAKKEKEETSQLFPMERPIILPGGRKWSRPDDATRSPRHPKISDEKIDQTITSYYEIGHWNEMWPWTRVTQPIYRESNCFMVPSTVTQTKKINFLKYQPPPNNMNHLQKSEVYKMVHDMEPPPRGITARPEKVHSQDDYVKKNGEVEKELPPQMER